MRLRQICVPSSQKLHRQDLASCLSSLLTLYAKVAREISVDEHRPPKTAFLRKALHLEDEGLETCPHGFHKEDSVLFRGCDERAKLRRVGRNGFLAENVLACSDGIDCGFVVVGVRSSLKRTDV